MRLDSTRPISTRHLAAPLAALALGAIAPAFACTRAPNGTTGVGDVGSFSGEGGSSVVSTGGPGGFGGCTSATASKDCDDFDPCTKDVCLIGECAHAPSSACTGPGALVFAEGHPNGGVPDGASVAVGPDDTIFVASVFTGSILVDGVALAGPGPESLLLRKLDAKGTLLGQKLFGCAGGLSPVAMAADGEGGIVLTGSFLDTTGAALDFGGGPLGTKAQAITAFAARLDANGNHVWSAAFPGDGSTVGTSVAVHPGGAIAISGSFTASVILGALKATGTSTNDTFVAELDGAGKPLWVRAFADDGNATAYAGHRLAFDAAGDLVVAGSFTGKADVGGGMTGTVGDQGAFVTRLDATGATVWSDTFALPGGSSALVQGATVDGAGNIVVSGAFAGTVAFGAGPLTTMTLNDHDLFVVAFDAAGKASWSRSFGDTSDQLRCTVATDAAGDVLIAGAFQGQLTLGKSKLTTTTPADEDVFVGVLDPLGNGIWGRRFGDGSSQQAISLAADSTGALVVGGVFLGAIDFGAGPIQQAQPGSSVFVAKLAP